MRLILRGEERSGNPPPVGKAALIAPAVRRRFAQAHLTLSNKLTTRVKIRHLCATKWPRRVTAGGLFVVDRDVLIRFVNPSPGTHGRLASRRPATARGPDSG